MKIPGLKQSFAKTASFLVLLIYGVVSLAPLAWTLLSSIKRNDEILVSPISLPSMPVFSNYPTAWVKAEIGRYFINTILYVAVATIAVVVIAAMAAYVLARIKKGVALSTFFTLGIMVPLHTVLLPIFLVVRFLGIINTRLSIMLVFTANNLAMSIFIMTGFLKSFPASIEEAALIDGCSRVRTFFQIVFPLSKPGLASIATLAFLNCWNEYLTPLILLTESKLKVLTLGIQELRGLYLQDYGLICTGIVLSTLPVILLYTLLQENFVAGLTAGAVKS